MFPRFTISYGVDKAETNQNKCNLCWSTIFLKTADIQEIKNYEIEIRREYKWAETEYPTGFMYGRIGNLGNIGPGYNALGFATSRVPLKLASITPLGVICLL